MSLGKTLFAQLMEFVPWTSFARIVARHGGDSGVRNNLSCTEKFRATGFRAPVKRSTLDDPTKRATGTSGKIWRHC